jgi:hypothetical protein
MIETQFTVVAFVDYPMVIRWRELGDIALILINPIQQRIEGGTEIEAPAATVAHIVDP